MRGQSLSAGEHMLLRGWGTPEGRALRDMSLTADVMVKRGIPDQKYFGYGAVQIFKYKASEIDVTRPNYSTRFISCLNATTTLLISELSI